ncbi:FG-GAP-like repeat-containing protein [Sphingomonas sp. DT-204]|uniref:FG-GAP-like repeat-containing protein n=1 Tax=Sphingomonas sp. DT-204 TaxID=3396166 RepID=UPI003F1DE7A7
MSSFEIPDGPATVALTSGDGQSPYSGTAVYAVTNKSPHPVSGRPSVQVTGTAKAEWFTIKGEAVRQFAPGESQTIEVAISVPPNTPSGDHKFRLRVVAVNDPDNDHMESPIGTFTVPSRGASKFPWWILIAALGALALAALLLALFVWPGYLRPKPQASPTPRPVPTAPADEPAPTPAAAVTAMPGTDCRWHYSARARSNFRDLIKGPPLYRLRFGDFDGDGKTDAFTSVAKGNNLFQWFFSPGGAAPFRPLGSGPDLAALGFGDFDGDGKTDVFTGTPAEGGSFQWRFSPGGAGALQDLRLGPDPKQVGFGDFDGDGTTDVFTAAPTGAGTYRWQYYPGGRRNARVLATGPELSELRFGDFDGDGTTDIFYSVPSTLYPPPAYAWMIAFKGSEPPRKTADGDQTNLLRFGDFDGDGKTDTLATYAMGDGNYQWKYSSAANSNYQNLAIGPGYGELGIGDFDGDGSADAFAAQCG